MAVVRERPDFSISRVDVPDVGSIFTNFADRQMRQHQVGLDNAMQQAKMEEDRRRYEIDLGFKQRQEGRTIDELNRAQATREAVQAQLNPDMYRNSKLGEVDRAIEYGLSNLSPQDRAIAEQEIAANYDKNATGQYVLDRARTNEMVDPTAVLKARSDDLTMKLQDPNSAEYKALLASRRAEDKWKADYSHGLAMSRINAEEQKEYKKGQQLADLLNINTFKTVDAGDNQRVIDENIKSNNARAYRQELYGQAMYDLALDDKTKQKPGESDAAFYERIDALAKDKAGIPRGNRIGQYAEIDVPKYEKYTKTVQLTPQEQADRLMSGLQGKDLTPAMVKEVQNQIKSYSDMYNNQSKEDRELAVKAATLKDLKEIISRNGGDASKYSTIDGAKAAVKEIEARLKSGNKSNSKVYGTGADSLLAKNETGLSDKAWANIKAAASNKKISDADLGKMIKASDLPNDWWFTWSSTQEDLVKDMLKSYPDK